MVVGARRAPELRVPVEVAEVRRAVPAAAITTWMPQTRGRPVGVLLVPTRPMSPSGLVRRQRGVATLIRSSWWSLSPCAMCAGD